MRYRTSNISAYDYINYIVIYAHINIYIYMVADHCELKYAITNAIPTSSPPHSICIHHISVVIIKLRVNSTQP